MVSAVSSSSQLTFTAVKGRERRGISISWCRVDDSRHRRSCSQKCLSRKMSVEASSVEASTLGAIGTLIRVQENRVRSLSCHRWLCRSSSIRSFCVESCISGALLYFIYGSCIGQVRAHRGGLPGRVREQLECVWVRMISFCAVDLKGTVRCENMGKL